jgi:hypothetical protein
MAGSHFSAGRKFAAAIVIATALTQAQGAVPIILQPKWVELPREKQEVLIPLAGEWDQLEAWRKKKWLDIAERYPRMSTEEQERMQRRMKAWVKLTPEERKAAREKYKNVQQASPEQREALKIMWSQYQTLPDEEKQRLQQSANRAAGQAISDNGSPRVGTGSTLPIRTNSVPVTPVTEPLPQPGQQ